ncbi:PGPGW domain-containing protein [Mycetocola sp. 2940]|uniref:PGPGW domain-containing protein n=1 Tax=Mycetocola sp. 2940 TaxID=3156452 RepID=UPI0033936BB8
MSAKQPRKSVPTWVKRRAIELAGWMLLVAGVAALVLPGPGLLCLAAGLALLAMRYKWAKRLLLPVKAKALLLASQGAQTWPRIVSSILGGLALVAIGIVWGIGTPTPGWWPVAGRWWLMGGWGTGITLIASGGIAMGMILYSFRRFHGHPLAGSDRAALMSVGPPATKQLRQRAL